MKSIYLTITLILSCLGAVTIGAQTITNGIPWYDQDGKPVSAHGANIIRDGGKYYMFGEFKTDSANVFTGFSCYSSSNLSDWRFEGIAFSQQSPSLSSQPSQAGAQLWRMGPNRVGERPKVLKCPKTGEYVMLMHTDNMQYKDPCTCYATSKTITGPYEFQGPILYKGKPVTKWDIGSFMDDDGRGYLLVHHGMIYRLAEDFHSLDSCLMSGVKGAGESPAMMKKDGIYYWMSSHTTSWERNDNMYWTATSLSGPWTYRGEFCPVGSLTWNSQCSFLLSIDGQWMYMGDRWSFPRQHQAATYVWLPIEAKDSVLSITEYMESWDVATGKPVSLPLKTIAEGRTLSNPGDSFTVNFIAQDSKLKAQNSKLKAQSSKFEGTRIGLKGRTDENSGYAEITILNNKQQVVFETSVDFYSKTPATGLRWLSPVLPQGEYTLLVRCSEMKPNWTDKKRIIYGSKGHKVEVSEVVTVIDHATAQTATWIWYPGDMDIWTGSRINDLRTENGSYYPAFWRNDYHYQTVEFSKTFQLDKAEEVAINAEGHYGVRIDSHGYLFGMPKTFTVPKGRHTLRISVHNMTSPPAIWLKGKTIVSDTTWTVSNFADAQRADTWYEMDGTLTFAKPTERPSEYRLPTTPIQPIKQQKDGNTLFAEFAREGIGYLQLNGVKGNGQINICYGESPDEARDKQHAYLKDRVLFTQDSIIDLQTMKGTYRPQAYIQESAIPSQTPLTSYRLPSSRAMRYVTVETEGDVSVESVTLLSEMKDLTPGSVRESAISSQTNSQFKIQNSQFETTRYANIFAVLYGYADKEQSASILNKVLLNDSVMPITTPYMRFYELEALCALGEQQRVLKEMRSYWGGMLREGATTFWETYDPTEQYPQRLAMYGHRYGKSLCHAWGASPIYLLGKYYLGIQPTKAGYEAWECRPCLGGLKWMKGDVPTPHGNIHIEMTRRQVTIEATGCGTGTLFIGKKRITIEPNKRITTKY